MNRSMKVVVDADSLVARAFDGDVHHLKTLELSKWLKGSNSEIIYPNTAIIEAVTALQRKLNNTNLAKKTAEFFKKNPSLVIEVNNVILHNALDLFYGVKSKKNTLFDCIVYAVAKEYKADAIFSFDKFYNKMGFKLVSDLVRKEKKVTGRT